MFPLIVSSFCKLNKVLGFTKLGRYSSMGSWLVPFYKIQNPGSVRLVTFRKMVVRHVAGAGVVAKLEEIL
jgi:hypothetical protein